MRRRSRSRGSVVPPTQRLTVFTDTPSWRAAASMVSPSLRSTPAIQLANDSSSAPVTAWRAVSPSAAEPLAAAFSTAGGRRAPSASCARRSEVSASMPAGALICAPDLSTSTST